eukprot:TRINITY_DN52191_c0_g1_i1.p1 TRINITY_DN52191_c0_g1~~TRINITY_DN52191_c0_g1_i1.p1  ORF type:complete len:166 (-),score=43.46 TRINITY_DN52191_c0_g1_i1:467-964(-)
MDMAWLLQGPPAKAPPPASPVWRIMPPPPKATQLVDDSDRLLPPPVEEPARQAAVAVKPMPGKASEAPRSPADGATKPRIKAMPAMMKMEMQSPPQRMAGSQGSASPPLCPTDAPVLCKKAPPAGFVPYPKPQLDIKAALERLSGGGEEEEEEAMRSSMAVTPPT